jgi:hypothetical protein
MIEYRTLLRASVLVAAGLCLMSCESVREAAGIVKQPPDEFAVVSKAPLIIPPDYNLHPPKPGAPPLNQQSPTQNAQAALYGDDTAAVAATIGGNYSQAEKLLLAQSGAATAEDGIRRTIAADNTNAEDTGTLTDSLLFGGSSTPVGDKPVDAQAESARVGGQDASKPSSDQKEQATVGKDNSSWWPF